MADQSYHKRDIIIGEKIRRIRTFRNIKQEYVAMKLGVSQAQVSKIESQEEIDNSLLSQIAEILGVTPEMIENFDEERAIYNINNFYDVHDIEIKDSASNNFVAQVFNNSDKGETIEKIQELYERLLQSEREKIDILKAIK